MELLVLLLMITCVTHLNASNNCSNLVVYVGNEKHEVSSCTEYGTDACKNGVRGGFPDNLLEGTTAPKPPNLRVTHYREHKAENGYISEFSGLNISWNGPGSDTNLLKGYYIKLEKVGSGGVHCRLFDLRGVNMTRNTNAPLDFSYTWFPLMNSGLHIVRLFSLPLNSSDTQVYKIVTLEPPKVVGTVSTFSTVNSTAATTTYATANLATTSVDYSTSTTINSSDTLPSIASSSMSKQRESASTTSATTHTSTAERRPSIAVSNTTTMKTPSTGNSTTSIQMSPSQRESASDVDVIVPAVLVSLVLVIGVLVAVCLWRRRQDVAHTCPKLRHRKDDAVSHSQETGGRYISTAPARAEGLPMPRITRKTVLLLASDDHTYFSQALHNFSTFLKLHCQCDVMFASEQLADVHKTENSYIWLSGKVNSADFVIIVASEASFRLYQASQNGMVYKEAHFGPGGDLFTPGIKHICGKIATGEDVSKVMMVRFAHTQTKHRLPISALPPCFYLLPDRLKSFLFHVHRLDEHTMDLSRVNLPLQGNVEELQGGKEWLSAVKESIAFEQDHPHWFEEKYGKPVDRDHTGTPVYTVPISGLSNESGFFEDQNPGNLQRRLSSVSTHAEKMLRRPMEKHVHVVDNPSVAFTSDFIPPSVFDANSAFTVPYSDYTASERPHEIDDGCRVSHQLRLVNDRYEETLTHEENQLQEPDPVSKEDRRVSGETAEFSKTFQNPPSHGEDSSIVEMQDHEEDLECLSVFSVTSV